MTSAFLWNLDWQEIVVVGVLAVIVFGGRLPHIAAEVVRTILKLRRSFDDLRSDTGIDCEIREAQDSLRDLARDATLDPEPPAPPRLSPEPEAQSEPEGDS